MQIHSNNFAISPIQQGGGTPLQSLQAATVVKILTEKIYNDIAYILRLYVLLLKFCLTLTNLTMPKRYSSLTVDYEEYFKLTVDFHFDRGRSSEYRPL